MDIPDLTMDIPDLSMDIPDLTYTDKKCYIIIKVSLVKHKTTNVGHLVRSKLIINDRANY